MTAAVNLGDRAEIGGRLRTLGLSTQGTGNDCAIAVAETGQLLEHPLRNIGIPPCDLLRAIPLESGIEMPRDARFTIGDIVQPQEVLGVVARWFHAEAGRVQGIVVAIHGAVKLTCENAEIVARNLVEVEFTTPDSGGTELPTTAKEDSGALVTTFDGRVIGILIAGIIERAYVVPVSDFFSKCGLTHRTVERDGGIPFPEVGAQLVEQEAAGASLQVELAREESFGLESFLAAA